MQVVKSSATSSKLPCCIRITESITGIDIGQAVVQLPHFVHLLTVGKTDCKVSASGLRTGSTALSSSTGQGNISMPSSTGFMQASSVPPGLPSAYRTVTVHAPQTPPAQPVLTRSPLPAAQSALIMVSPALAEIGFPEILISIFFIVISMLN